MDMASVCSLVLGPVVFNCDFRSFVLCSSCKFLRPCAAQECVEWKSLTAPCLEPRLQHSHTSRCCTNKITSECTKVMVWTQDYTIVLCGLYAFPVCVCWSVHTANRGGALAIRVWCLISSLRPRMTWISVYEGVVVAGLPTYIGSFTH